MLVIAPDGENWLAESKPWESGLISWKSGDASVRKKTKKKKIMVFVLTRYNQ